MTWRSRQFIQSWKVNFFVCVCWTGSRGTLALNDPTCYPDRAKMHEWTAFNSKTETKRLLASLKYPCDLINWAWASRLWDKPRSLFVIPSYSSLASRVLPYGILSSHKKPGFPEGLCYWHIQTLKSLLLTTAVKWACSILLLFLEFNLSLLLLLSFLFFLLSPCFSCA